MSVPPPSPSSKNRPVARPGFQSQRRNDTRLLPNSKSRGEARPLGAVRVKPLHVGRKSSDGLAPPIPPCQREDSGTRPRRISDWDHRDHLVSCPTDGAGSEHETNPVRTNQGLLRSFGDDANHPVFSSCYADLGQGVTRSAKGGEQAERAVSLATLYGGGSFNDFRVIASLPKLLPLAPIHAPSCPLGQRSPPSSRLPVPQRLPSFRPPRCTCSASRRKSLHSPKSAPDNACSR